MERYSTAIESYKKYSAAFPQGKHIREAKNIYEDCLKQIEKLTALNTPSK
jgi:hypothetical protein